MTTWRTKWFKRCLFVFSCLTATAVVAEPDVEQSVPAYTKNSPASCTGLTSDQRPGCPVVITAKQKMEDICSQVSSQNGLSSPADAMLSPNPAQKATADACWRAKLDYLHQMNNFRADNPAR